MSNGYFYTINCVDNSFQQRTLVSSSLKPSSKKKIFFCWILKLADFNVEKDIFEQNSLWLPRISHPDCPSFGDDGRGFLCFGLCSQRFVFLLLFLETAWPYSGLPLTNVCTRFTIMKYYCLSNQIISSLSFTIKFCSMSEMLCL